MTQTVFLTNSSEFFMWWDENDGEEAGIIHGLDGDDRIYADAGDDQLYGGTGDDSLYGGNPSSLPPPDYIAVVGFGGTTISGARRATIFSLPVTDGMCCGDTGNDYLGGGGGNDFLEGGSGANSYQGGNGIDTVSYISSATGLVADFLFTQNNTGEAAGDTYKDVENLRGTAFADHLGGNEVANRIDGSTGNDIVGGRGGNDTLRGEFGNDVLYGDAGADRLEGGDGSDWAGHEAATSMVVADLLFSGVNHGDAAGDTYDSIENLNGSHTATISAATTSQCHQRTRRRRQDRRPQRQRPPGRQLRQ